MNEKKKLDQDMLTVRAKMLLLVEYSSQFMVRIFAFDFIISMLLIKTITALPCLSHIMYALFRFCVCVILVVFFVFRRHF